MAESPGPRRGRRRSGPGSWRAERPERAGGLGGAEAGMPRRRRLEQRQGRVPYAPRPGPAAAEAR